MKEITDSKKAREILNAGGFKFLPSYDTRRLDFRRDRLFEFRVHRRLDVTQTKDTIAHQLIEAAKASNCILAIAGSKHERISDQFNDELIIVNFTLEQKENVCRNCGITYNPERSRADYRGYCSQKCLKQMAKNLGAMPGDNPWTFLRKHDAVGDIFEGGPPAKRQTVNDALFAQIGVLTSDITESERLARGIEYPAFTELDTAQRALLFAAHMTVMVRNYIADSADGDPGWADDFKSVEAMAIDFTEYINNLEGSAEKTNTTRRTR